MKRIQFILILLVISSVVDAQKDKVILNVAGSPIYKSEFEYVFRKNNDDTAITNQDLDNYMELFINYKLKVKEAEDMGLDTVPGFVKELDGYRNQLAIPYLRDSEVTEELIKEAYQRMQSELRASHILVKVASDATPEDTLVAYKKIIAIRKEIISGSDFAKIARLNSQDPSVKTNGGDLGYFTVFQMVYDFETAAYNTPVTEISQPVRTRFGYHLIYVTDKRQARGDVKVAHILILANDKRTPEQNEKAKMKIYEIYNQIGNGADFGSMARKYSDDKGSAAKGGELPLFGTGKMVPEFENAAFSLKEVGDVSEPFQSQFGWHIIKLIEVDKIGSFEELNLQIEKKIKRDSRGQLSKKAFVNELKKEYKYKEYPENIEPFYTWVDTMYYSGIWKPNPNWDTGKTLFVIGKKKYTQKDFIDYLLRYMSKAKRGENKTIHASIDFRFKKYSDNAVLNYEKAKLEDKYPEFKALMNEYHDGILLFELSDEKIWNKAASDSIGLEAFYQKNKDKYMWPKRIDGVIYRSIDEKTAGQVRKLVKERLPIDSILNLVNQNSQLNLLVDSALMSAEEYPVLKEFNWEFGISDIHKIEGQFVFIKVKELRKPEPKTLDEIKGLIITEYQTYLEQEWIKELRGKYSYEINTEVLYTVTNN